LTDEETGKQKSQVELKFFFVVRLKITNSFYRHKGIHKFTWEVRGNKSAIDHVIINDRLKSNIEDIRVF
jgi:hypothetical protein